MKSKILLIIVCLLVTPHARSESTGEKATTTKFRHDMTLVIKLPTQNGQREIKLPWTIIINGQILEYVDNLENIQISLSVGEISSESVDLNYTITRNSGPDPTGRFHSSCYAEFKFNSPREISINSEKVVSLLLQKN